MGKNPLFKKINQVVRVLTHAIRMQTVEEMIKTDRGEELYQAHEEIYMRMERRDMADMNLAVRNTYFTEIIFGR